MRHFRRSPGLIVTAVLTLAAGITAVVAMFSIYSSAILHPVTAPRPESLVSIYSANHKVRFVPPALSWVRFQELRRGASVFSHLGAYSDDSVSLSGERDAPPEQLRVLRASGDFFQAVELAPLQGRLFAPEEDVPNGPAVCMLTHELWQSRFGGRNMIGATILLNGKPTEVVGVLPPFLSPPWNGRQIFLTRVFEDSGLTAQSVANGAAFLEVVGRLRRGATFAEAAEQVRFLSADYSSRFASHTDASSVAEIRPLTEDVAGSRRSALTLLLGAVAAVLLVSCANVAALFVSMLAARERDTAVRQALGAGRARIVAGFLRESLTFAIVAGVLGVPAAWALLAAAEKSLAAQFIPGVRLHLDGTAAVVALAAVFACAILVGLLPALHATRPSTHSPLAAFTRGTSESASTRRFRAALVVFEVGLSVCLLVTAALLLSSLTRLRQTSPGFDPEGVAAGFVNLPQQRYGTAEKQAAFFADVVERLRGNPQVTGAAVVFGLPFYDGNTASTYAVAGRPIPSVADRARAGLRIVTEDYFRVMRMQLIQGRAFTAPDRAGAPGVCIVNESLARRQFGPSSPIGQVIRRGRDADQFFEIVGVVADIKTNGLRKDTPDEVFLPLRQAPRGICAIVARTTGDPARLLPVFQSTVAAMDRDLPVSRFASMQDRLEGTLGSERLMAVLTGGFAGMAVLLACVGLGAVLAHSVTARTVEIGIRMALGAGRESIVQLVLSHALRLTGIGVAMGILAAIAGARLLAAQLYDVNPRDPILYAGVAAIFSGVAVAASLLPALRAAKIDPVVSLNRP